MEERKDIQMDIIRDQIIRDDYEVDPKAVAGAILERLLVGSAKLSR